MPKPSLLLEPTGGQLPSPASPASDSAHESHQGLNTNRYSNSIPTRKKYANLTNRNVQQNEQALVVLIDDIEQLQMQRKTQHLIGRMRTRVWLWYVLYPFIVMLYEEATSLRKQLACFIADFESKYVISCGELCTRACVLCACWQLGVSFPLEEEGDELFTKAVEQCKKEVPSTGRNTTPVQQQI